MPRTNTHNAPQQQSQHCITPEMFTQRKSNRQLQALDLLQRLDLTSKALARITGMPAKTASSVLCKFYQLGAVTRERAGMDVRGRSPYLYSIKRAA